MNVLKLGCALMESVSTWTVVTNVGATLVSNSHPTSKCVMVGVHIFTSNLKLI